MGGQITSYKHIVGKADRALSSMRSIHRIITSTKFLLLLQESQLEDADILEDIIQNNDLGRLKKWVSDHMTKTLNDLSTLELRRSAREHKIKNYSNLTKVELIIAIIKKETLND